MQYFVRMNAPERSRFTPGALPLRRLTPPPRSVSGVPVMFLSAINGHGVADLMPQVSNVYAKWCTRLSTARLNRWLLKVQARHMRGKDGYGAQVRYLTQVKARPPTFVAFFSGVGELPDSELRFLASAIREDFGLSGIPLRVLGRRKGKGSALSSVKRRAAGSGKPGVTHKKLQSSPTTSGKRPLSRKPVVTHKPTTSRKRTMRMGSHS
ncbi:hypothetical protein CBR_g2954 [Chara braunii]|uniref:GTPase Der C-terminal KH-domain-like domain-containing protein n=1 Tax=Chara braunii TaxID=69332 RepID=A0A388KED3_CHABU|nr:hypothetical protein CBR_g2954 [Chara braunii]|eukprot:GBG68409.1 hypothetical protein CBR_g2954 [Chara braunii]